MQIVRMLFGSHVYGCNTPTSDTDYKGVFIPDMRDILLGKAPKTSVNKTTGQQNSRNSAGDVDEEFFTLQGYLRLMAEGQLVALDMLFTPDEFILGRTPLWDEVVKFCKQNLLSKTTTAYVGYCRKQASKYGIKGSRVSEVREILTLLRRLPINQTSKLCDWFEELQAHCIGKEHTAIVERTKGPPTNHPYGTKLLMCCGRQASMTASVQSAIEMYQRVFDAYGARAVEAETNLNVDWKAMHHAARCCYEAIELLDRHQITFPLPSRDYLMLIKQGKLPYVEVASHLEGMMAQVDECAKLSTLPEQPNWQALDDFIYEIYKKEITHA